MKEEYIYIGTIVNTRGYEGGLFVDEVPEAFVLDFEEVNAKVGYSINFSSDFLIKKWKNTKKGAHLSLDGIMNKEQGAKLKEMGVFAKESELVEESEKPLMNDEIIGCKVVEYGTDVEIGEVIDVWDMPANDVWLVDTPSGHLPIPVTQEVIKDINLNKRNIEITVIDGLMDIITPKK